MITCPRCQYQNPDNLYYCINCGEKLARIAEQIALDYCPFCSAPLPPGARFCTWCGREVSLAKPIEIQPEIPPQYTHEQSERVYEELPNAIPKYVPEQVPSAQQLPSFIPYLPPYKPPKRYGKIIAITAISIAIILISGVVIGGFIKDYLLTPTPWAKQDSDNDGLTNEQEQQLGSNISSPDLFLEIDYMSGCGPSNAALDYFSSYYLSLGITVHITTTEVTESQLQAIGVLSPASLDANECSVIEQHFHSYSTTHVYVFYAKAIDGNLLGWSNYFGAFIDCEAVNNNGALQGTTPEKVEKVVLLHEVGHCINIVELDSGTDEDNDGTIENYCNNESCIMAKGETFLWTNIATGVITLDSPMYCAHHWYLHNLKDKWSVDEPT